MLWIALVQSRNGEIFLKEEPTREIKDKSIHNTQRFGDFLKQQNLCVLSLDNIHFACLHCQVLSHPVELFA